MNDIRISVKFGNALEEEGNILVLKYAQDTYGLDRKVVRMYDTIGESLELQLPNVGGSLYIENRIKIGVKNILFIGVPPLSEFGYQEIREFGRTAMYLAGEGDTGASKIIFTIHGANFGLDEIEAFEAQIAGIVDEISTHGAPPNLKEIIFVEYIEGRVRRLAETLRKIFPKGIIPTSHPKEFWNLGSESIEKLRSAGYASAGKKRVFVAMPFAERFEDVYHYGIQGAVKEAGYLCERADLESFTGDVMEWVKKRIRTADYLLADLTNANANVYLEVGYAWGCNVPTILLAQDSNDLKFDVKGQRCLVYTKIKELEEKLTKELMEFK